MNTKKETILKNTYVVCFLALICCALWGSAFPCVKIGYTLFGVENSDISSQILFAGVRFTLAGIMAILISSIISKKVLIPKKESIPLIVKLCVFQTVLQYIFFYVGLANTSGVKASIIESMNVFISIFVASIIAKQEKLTSYKVIGCIIGIIGVIIINLNAKGIDTNLKLIGEGFIFISTFAYAISSVLIKSYSKKENPVILSGYQFFIGGIFLMILGYMLGGHIKVININSIYMLVYLGVISSLAYSIWGILLKYNDVSKVTVFGFMNPVFGVILSALFLGEVGQAFGLKSLVALFLVSMGIIIVNKLGDK